MPEILDSHSGGAEDLFLFKHSPYFLITPRTCFGDVNVSLGVEFFLELGYLVNVGNPQLSATAAHCRRSQSNLGALCHGYPGFLPYSV